MIFNGNQAKTAPYLKEPIKAIENLSGVDLPDNVIEKLAYCVMGTLTPDSVGDMPGSFAPFSKRKGPACSCSGAFL